MLNLYRRKAQRAFTLIELLVVIAIIAILAAILFPVFAQAKEAAKKSADLSNNKQINLGVQMYMTDYDDIFPMLRNGKTNWQNPVLTDQINSGHNMVQPYVKNKGIWRSPNDTMGRCDAAATGFSTNESLPTGGPVSYVFSYYEPDPAAARPYAFGLAAWDSFNPSTGVHSGKTLTSMSGTSVGAPANTIFLMPSYISWSYWTGLMQHRNDQREYAFPPSVLPTSALPTWPQVLALSAWCSGGSDRMALGAYGGITNWGFADGHVKAMKRDQIMDGVWASNPTLANTNNLRNLIHWDERFKK